MSRNVAELMDAAYVDIRDFAQRLTEDIKNDQRNAYSEALNSLALTLLALNAPGSQAGVKDVHVRQALIAELNGYIDIVMTSLHESEYIEEGASYSNALSALSRAVLALRGKGAF